MLGKLSIFFLVINGFVFAAKQCNERASKEVKLVKIYGQKQQLTGKALVDYINKQGKWKAQYNKRFAGAPLNEFKKLAGVKNDIQRVYARDPSVQSDYVPEFFSRIADSDIPKEFDARKRSVVAL